MLPNLSEMEGSPLKALYSAHLAGQSDAPLFFAHEGTEYVADRRKIDFPVAGYVAVYAPIAAFTGATTRARFDSLLFSLGILIVAVPLVLAVSWWIARPLTVIAEEVDRVRELNLDGKVSLKTPIMEVQRLATAVGRMKSTLAGFKTYVPVDLVKLLLTTGQEPVPGGVRREVTVMFSDVENFTDIGEEMNPESLMRHMSDYLDAMVGEITAEQGTVDKFIGDAVMSFWNAPRRQTDHPIAACRAALHCVSVSRALNARWRAEQKPPLRTRFGIHTGPVVVGNLGAKNRLNFTVLGASVNLASRLEALNKRYGTRILISGAVVKKIGEKFFIRPIDRVLPRGVQEPVEIFELMGEASADTDAASGLAAQCEAWKPVYAAYVRRDKSATQAAVETYLERFPDDAVAQLILKEVLSNDTSAQYDPSGVRVYETK
ncbi:MAG: hypothetical protein KDE14_03915 [Rhodobacteraceae bacterium]|nr:hypothetical protein [Paracoccaceae bacterium]